MEYNNKNRERQLKMDKVEYVSIYFNELPDLRYPRDYLIQEFDYALLFNFGHHNLRIA